MAIQVVPLEYLLLLKCGFHMSSVAIGYTMKHVGLYLIISRQQHVEKALLGSNERGGVST
jgi:hypothetical protein